MRFSRKTDQTVKFSFVASRFRRVAPPSDETLKKYFTQIWLCCSLLVYVINIYRNSTRAVTHQSHTLTHSKMRKQIMRAPRTWTWLLEKGVVVTASCQIGEGVRTQQAMKTKMKLGRLLNRFAPHYLMWREKTFPKIWALLRKFAVLPWRRGIFAALTVVEKFFCLLCKVDSLVESQGLLIRGRRYSSFFKKNQFIFQGKRQKTFDCKRKTKQGEIHSSNVKLVLFSICK